MGQSYFSSAKERKAYEARCLAEAKEADRLEKDALRRLSAKIVMAVVDKVVTEIVRPGPIAEERECYEMAGEFRAEVPELEALVVAILKQEKVMLP